MRNYQTGEYVKAGVNEFYRYGRKAQERVAAALVPHNGFYSIPVDGGKYYSIGTSEGKYGEYARCGNVFFSVNKIGNAWAKEGTEKAEAFVKMIQMLLDNMKEQMNAGRYEDEEGEDEE